MGYDIPEEFGGLGLGMMAKVIVWSEVSRTTALPARGMSIFGPPVSPILYTLEGQARENYLMPVIRGEKRSLLRADRSRCRHPIPPPCAPPPCATATTT